MRGRRLRKPAPAGTLFGLLAQHDGFARYCNTIRPHRGPERTHAPTGLWRPAQGQAGLGEAPQDALPHPPRRDRRQGTVTLRHDSKLHHIGIGRAHKGRAIELLVADRDIRVLDRGTGELIPAAHSRSRP